MRAMSIQQAAEVLRHSQNADERKAAADALGNIRGLDAAQGLLRIVEDPGWPVRQAAARVFGRLCEEAAAQALRTLSKDDNAVVRRTARQALAVLEMC
jgi:HEAT repeat protein